MTATDSVSEWIQRLKSGDQEAAQKLWERYFCRLVGLARTKLGEHPKRTADEEDVVVSVFDRLCQAAREQKFPRLDDRDDLWQVLIVLTERKAVDVIRRGTAEKRGGGAVRGESVFENANSADGVEQVAGDEPSPEFALCVGEFLRDLVNRLDDPTIRDVACLKLEGYLNKEIAERLGISLRSVERKLNLIRRYWEGPDV